MKAMRLHKIKSLSDTEEPLQLEDIPDPEPAEGELLLQVSVCGVCHTELDEIEGRTPPPELPVTPGHQVIGRVISTGSDVSEFSEGDRVGVGWIYSACGTCEHCKNGNENLCEEFTATGRDVDGGYAEKMTVPADYAERASVNAERYDTLSASDLVDLIVNEDIDAGSSVPVDLLAAKLIERSGVRTIVLDGTDPEAIVDAALYGEHDGTDVIPEGTDDEMSYWVQ